MLGDTVAAGKTAGCNSPLTSANLTSTDEAPPTMHSHSQMALSMCNGSFQAPAKQRIIDTRGAEMDRLRLELSDSLGTIIFFGPPLVNSYTIRREWAAYRSINKGG